ncbi:MAG: nucleotidyl transferase AbiEii/AbiGii toxin family protein, partial [Bdellovibrionales bacterium]|nr:nucleotidyl transferase AbiEii/AbiGii toxin family protein [Bdellovibrionales bacterium]
SILEQLEKNNCSYLIVGGLAVVLHGRARLTTDIDLIIALDKENCLKVLNCLEELGFKSRIPVNPKNFADANIRRNWIEEKGLTVMSFYSENDPLISVDLFVEHPLDYAEMQKRAVYKDLGEINVLVASIDDIIELKKISGRPKDLDDIEALELIKNG